MKQTKKERLKKNNDEAFYVELPKPFLRAFKREAKEMRRTCKAHLVEILRARYFTSQPTASQSFENGI